MVSSGVPKRNGLKHANNIADIALELLNAIYVFEIPQFPEEKLKIRIGLHAGNIPYHISFTTTMIFNCPQFSAVADPKHCTKSKKWILFFSSA